jgi:WD40 repeat protein
VKAWDTQEGRILFKKERDADVSFRPVYAVAWSPDGRLLAAASADGKVKIRDALHGEVLHDLHLHRSLVESWSVAWSPTGDRLAATVWRAGEIVVWDTDSWQEEYRIKAPGGWLYCIAWTPDGSRFATCSANGTIKIWNVETRQQEECLRVNSGAVYWIDWDSDGSRIASAGQDGSVVVWDPRRSLGRIEREDEIAADWSPDGQWLATVEREHRTLKVIDLTTGEAVFRRLCESGGGAPAFSPDGRLLAALSSGATLRVWEWSPDSRFMVTGSGT